MAIKCPKCNADNPDTKQFCGDCGTQLPSIKDIEVTETMEAPKEELTTGSTFAGRYQIIEELGKGGMGRVYKAQDTKIKEKIALKLIKPEIAKDKKTIERFSNELRLARKIRHKNVCGMFDLGEEKGTHYITMEFIPGEDLRSLIRRIGQLPIGKSISIATQICEGLAEAHRLGVVHRDLKSNNVMIDKEGNVRIMDFGIARSLEAKGITGAGVMIGTPEYMSPEQVEGKEADQRSDIYSFGVILYEMVTGRVPFEGDTPFAIGVKHKSEMPQNPMELNSQVPEYLSLVILKCMEKDKDKRYKSAGEVRSELDNIEKGIPSTERIVPKRKPITSKEITVTFGFKKLFIPALVIIAIAILAVVIWQFLPKEKEIPIPEEKPYIAVLPFADLSPQKDQEYFCDGMTDEIIAKLSRLEGLKVVPRTSVMRYKSAEKDIKVIGQELDVTTILEGSVRKEKDNIRVNASLISVADSSQLWSDTFDQKLTSVFFIQSEIAEHIADALIKKLSSEEKNLLQEKPTENIEAYNLYLLGRHVWNKRTEEDLRKAIEYFEKAIEVDSNYALAYTGIADSYLALPYYSYTPPKEASPKSKEATLKALKLDDTLAEAHTSLAWIKMSYEYDWEGAEREFKRAIELNPNYATAHHWYSFYLRSKNRFVECFAELDRALEIDPLSPVINRNLAESYYSARKFDKAFKIIQKTSEIDPNFSEVHQTLGYIYLQKSMYEEALKEFQKESHVYGSGITYARMGKRAEAQRVLDNLIKLADEKYFSAYRIAVFYFVLNEKDQGFKWMERGIEERDNYLIYLSTDPLLEDVRSDSRFTSLLKKINLYK